MQKQKTIQFLPQDKQILTQSIYKKLQFLKNIQEDNRKVMINFVGFNKQGKSYLCNEFLKVSYIKKQQSQLQEFQQFYDVSKESYIRQNLFPSYAEPMTSAKTYYESSYQLQSNQLYFQVVQQTKRQQLELQKLNFQLCYENLPKSTQNINKSNVFINNFQTLQKIRLEHRKWRDQIKQINLNTNPLEIAESEKRIFFNIKTFKLILQSVPINNFAMICDHPGQNQSQLKKSESQQSLQIFSQQSTQSQEIDTIYMSKQLQYRQGQIIIYCINHAYGLFTTDHIHNIQKLFQQNDPNLIILAFNFQKSISKDGSDLLLFYENMFETIPQRLLQIIKSMLQKKGKEYQSYIKNKRQKLQKIKQSLSRYIQFKNNLFRQTLTRNIGSEIRILRIQPRNLQNSDKIRIFAQKNRIQLFQYYPFELCHFFGLSGQNKNNPYEPIPRLQSTYIQIRKQLIKSLISKLKQIHEQVFAKISNTLQQAQNQIKIKKIQFALPIQDKQIIQKFYKSLNDTFKDFKKLFQDKVKEINNKIIVQKKIINEKLIKLKQKETQESLKNEYRFNMLLQEQVRSQIELYVNQATKNVKVYLVQFEQEFKKWIKKQLKCLKKNFQQLDILQQNEVKNKNKRQQSQSFEWRNILKLKALKQIFLNVNTQNQVSNQILQNFIGFLQKQIKNKLNNIVELWNLLIQSIQTSFSNIKFDIDLITITIVQDIFQQTKIQKQLSAIILSFFFGVANFFVTKFKSKRSRHYYQKEWKQLLNAIKPIQSYLIQEQEQSNFIDQMQNQANGELILRSKLVQKIQTLEVLEQKVYKIKDKVQVKKTKILQTLKQG